MPRHFLPHRSELSEISVPRTYLTGFRGYSYEPVHIAPDARSSPITPVAMSTLLDGLKRGLTRPAAAARAGIPIGTLEIMVGRGIRIAAQRPDTLYQYDWDAYQLFIEVGRAEAELELQQVEKWLVNGATDWTSQRDFLARRFPDTWSASQKIDMTVKKMTNDDLIAMIQTLMADITTTDPETELLEAERVDGGDTNGIHAEAGPGATGDSVS